MLVLVALGLAAIGICAALAPFWAMPPLFLSGTGAAAGIALINGLGNLGGFAGPFRGGLGQTDHRFLCRRHDHHGDIAHIRRGCWCWRWAG